MSETLSFAATAGAWVEVADGSDKVLVSTGGRSDFLVHVGAAAPSLTAPAFLGCATSPVSLSGLDAADKVFARGAVQDALLTVLRS